MLCEIDTFSAKELKSYLIHEHGILIRDCSNFFGLSSQYFRVAAQLPEENDALVSAIKDFIESKKHKDFPPLASTE